MGWIASDIANWLDEQHRVSDSALAEVMKNPGSLGFVTWLAAGSVRGSMFAGKGFWDVLRLGEGVQQGGWGIGQDGLRLLTVLPMVQGARAMGAGAKLTFASSNEAAQAARVVAPGIFKNGAVTPGGELVKDILIESSGAGANSCTLLTASRAMAAQLGGTKANAFMTVAQIANKVGAVTGVETSFSVLPNLFKSVRLTAVLHNFPAGAASSANAGRNAATLLQRLMKPGDVAMVNVAFDTPGNVKMAHAVLAYFDDGMLKIIDQPAANVVREFTEFGPRWIASLHHAASVTPLPNSIVIQQVVVIEQAGGKILTQLTSVLAALAVGTNAAQPPGFIGPPRPSTEPAAVNNAYLHAFRLPLLTGNLLSPANATLLLKTRLKR